MSTATQKRLDRLEQAIKPEKKTEVGSFYSKDYKDQEERDQAIEAWSKGLPEGVEGVVIELMGGFKGWVWDWWERAWCSPDEMKMRIQDIGDKFPGYGQESTALDGWGLGFEEGTFKEDNRKFIKAR